MEQPKHLVLCIEDDPDTCDLIAFVFNECGFKVEFSDHTNWLRLIKEKTFAAIILNNYLGEIKGSDICREIRSYNHSIPIIFFSGEARESEIEMALEAGANSYLVKPNGFEQLVPTVTDLIQQTIVNNR